MIFYTKITTNIFLENTLILLSMDLKMSLFSHNMSIFSSNGVNIFVGKSHLQFCVATLRRSDLGMKSINP